MQISYILLKQWKTSKTEWFPKAEHCKKCILPIYLDIIKLEEMNQIVAHITHEKK